MFGNMSHAFVTTGAHGEQCAFLQTHLGNVLVQTTSPHTFIQWISFLAMQTKKNEQIDKNGRASSVTGLVVEEIPDDVKMMVQFRFSRC